MKTIYIYIYQYWTRFQDSRPHLSGCAATFQDSRPHLESYEMPHLHHTTGLVKSFIKNPQKEKPDYHQHHSQQKTGHWNMSANLPK